MPERSADWINQATKDLEAAKQDIPIALNLAAHMNISPGRMQRMPSFIVEESLNSARVFWLDHERLLREIYQRARELGEKEDNVMKVVLFGSVAEKRAVPGSDVDILIVLKGDNKSFLERIAEWSEKLSLDFPTEVFPYTEQELNNPLALEAIRKGVILFER